MNRRGFLKALAAAPIAVLAAKLLPPIPSNLSYMARNMVQNRLSDPRIFGIDPAGGPDFTAHFLYDFQWGPNPKGRWISQEEYERLFGPPERMVILRQIGEKP